jgi:hypothetical protein
VFRARVAALQSPIYFGLGLLAALLVCCWLVDKCYDFPIRRMLTKAWRSKAKAGVAGPKTQVPQ